MQTRQDEEKQVMLGWHVDSECVPVGASRGPAYAHLTTLQSIVDISNK